MVLNQTKYNKAFSNRITDCLKAVTTSYGNILDIPEKKDIIFNYEYMKEEWLAVATVNPNMKVTQNIISFNPMHVEQHFEAFVEDIVPHELAHIVCFINMLDEDHGENWQEMCVEMGGSGEQFHRI